MIDIIRVIITAMVNEHVAANSLSSLMALPIWFFTVFSDSDNCSAISLYFMPLSFDNRKISLHFGGRTAKASDNSSSGDFLSVSKVSSSGSCAPAEGESSIETV